MFSKSKLWVGSSAFMLSMSTVVSAAQLSLSNTPLVVAEPADPNIMVLFDTSGSMEDNYLWGSYDSSRNSVYNNGCASATSNIITYWRDSDGDGVKDYNENTTLYFRPKVDVTDGSVEIEYDGDSGFGSPNGTYIWGTNTTAGTGCFDSAETYRLELDVLPYGEYSNSMRSVSGSFLNWYFSNYADLPANQNTLANGNLDTSDDINATGPANFGVGNLQKDGVGSRNSVAITSLLDLIGTASDADRLQNARVGLAGFDANYDQSRADVLSHLVQLGDDTDTTEALNRTNLLATIKTLDADGSTPLATALATLGRYFVEGYTTENLATWSEPVYGDDPSTPLVIETNFQTGTNSQAGDLFNKEPDYSTNSLAKPVATPSVGNPLPANSVEVMQYSCQKNFIIAMTDGEPTTEGIYKSDLSGWVDNATCNRATDRGGPNDICKKETTSNRGDFDDVAAALYDLDLRPQKYPKDKNNVITYPIGFDLGTLPVLQNAANESNSTYYTPKTASQLTANLRSIAEKVKEETSSVASVAFNSGRVINGQTSTVFQAKFGTPGFFGQLYSYPLDGTTGVIDFVGDGAGLNPDPWEAGAKLAALTTTAQLNGRKIFTNTDTSTGVEFLWANLTTAQQNDLSFNDPTITGANTLSFIRGDNTIADTRLRDAPDSLTYTGSKFVLGDVVNSTPVFVGAPELNWPDYDSTATAKFGGSGANQDYSYYKANTTRTPVVYAGANDGMLHGFDATPTTGGAELMAYIPGVLFSDADPTSGLHYLADPEYEHKFYVDLTPTVSDVYIDNGTTTEWRTVLLGGLRGGGKGLFLLDVTDPDDFVNVATTADDLVLWEFTSADDADLGFTYSQPTIAMMPNGKWAAIVGNGYNSTNENAALFIIYLDGGVDGTWTPTTDYIKIPVTTGTGNSNGLSTPRVVDLDGDYIADRVYAGDLQGNMWVFDVTATTGVSNSTTGWRSAYVDAGGNPEPLITAVNSSNQPQPITSAPILAKNTKAQPTTGNDPNVLVMFGTGRFLEPDDRLNNTEVQAYYGVWDSGESNLNPTTDLVERTITTQIDVPFPDPSDASKTIYKNLRSIDPSSGSIGYVEGTPTSGYGWFMNLTNSAASPIAQGERVVTDSLLRREVLLFNTIIPDQVPCSGGGSGWLMSLDFLSGLGPSFSVFDTNNDGLINSDDLDGNSLSYVGEEFVDGIPSKSGVLGDYQYTPGSKGTIEKREIDVGAGDKQGRLSWEEIFRN